MKLFVSLISLLLLVEASHIENNSFKNEKLFENKRESNIKKLSSIIIKKFTALKEQVEKEDCMITVMEKVINQIGDTYMFIKDGDTHENLLLNLQNHFVHSFFTDPNLLKKSKPISFRHVVMFHNRVEVKEVLEARKPAQGTKFVVMVKDYEDAVKIFKQLWEYRAIHVVASFVENGTAYFYTYYPYHMFHCSEVGAPFLIATCNVSNRVLTNGEKFFKEMAERDLRKIIDLHGCPINITFTENVPASYYSFSGKPTGWEVEFMNKIIERMNGVPQYKILLPPIKVYERSKGYSRLLENSEVAGGLLITLRGLMKTDFCLYGYTLCTSWVVPKKFNTLHSINFLYKVFPIGVWGLIILCFAVTACIFKIIFDVPLDTIIFKLLPYLLGTTTQIKRTSRLLGGFWLWFCVLVNAFYQSGYQSTSLVPSKPVQLSTSNEVLKSNLKILGVSDIITDSLPYFRERYNLSPKRLRFVNKNLSYKRWVYRMTIRKDSAFLGFKETAHYHIDRTELARKLHIQQNCIIRYFLAFVLKRNSHLTESFVRLSNQLNENGYLVYLIRKHLSESRVNVPKKLVIAIKSRKEENESEQPPFVNMDKMFGVFICYGIGNLIALTAFSIEIMIKWHWKKNIKTILTKVKFI